MTTPESSTTNAELLLALLKMRAISARYAPESGEVVIHLSTGMSISFSPSNAAGLEKAEANDLKQIEVSPSGLGLHFPSVDADLYLPPLIVGILRPKRHNEASALATNASTPALSPEDRCSYTVRWSVEDQEFVATCDAFPSISWLARSSDQALLGARNLVRTIWTDLANDQSNHHQTIK